jgi:hypothetical protein
LRRKTFLSFAVLSAVTGCNGSPCEQSADQVRQRLEDCGVKFAYHDADLTPDCTAEIEARYACYAACYEKSACSDYVSNDNDNTTPFVICLSNCH